jgi:hypothetical protein
MITIPVSVGELIDKLSILHVKQTKITKETTIQQRKQHQQPYTSPHQTQQEQPTTTRANIKTNNNMGRVLYTYVYKTNF